MNRGIEEIPRDAIKQISDWALEAGRYFQSSQTGYLHLYQGESEKGAQTIPLYENALFALALFRTRLTEQIQEAKMLLKGVLAFQNLEPGSDSYGNFPYYLHSYPACSDRTQAARILAPFYWILRQFGQILGSELRLKLEESAALALRFSLQTEQSKPLPYHLSVRLAAAQAAYGEFFNEPQDVSEGNRKLAVLAQNQLDGWNSTANLGELLAGLQMAYPSLLHSIWKPLWHFMEQTWHQKTASYIGPCIRERQEKGEPQTNLYDLYGGYFSGHFSKRSSSSRLSHLNGILIRPVEERFEPFDQKLEGIFHAMPWMGIIRSFGAYTLLQKEAPLMQADEKGYTPLRLIWGDREFLHSLVCQGGSSKKTAFNQTEEGFNLIFELSSPYTSEERYAQREIEFFADTQPGAAFTLQGNSTSVFHLNERLLLSFKDLKLSLTFELLEGEGDFLGHISRGNRPSQIESKGFESYDWTFFLRTLRRSDHCVIKAIFCFHNTP